MICIKLMGGLGNQIFQYAFGKNFFKKGIDVYFDNEWFERNAILRGRFNRLPNFGVEINYKGFWEGNRYLKENNKYCPEFLLLDNFNFDGYWQYYPYFKEFISELKTEFKLKDEFKTHTYNEYFDKIKSTNSISVHVRRGDYLKQKGWGVLGFGYYLEALKWIEGDLFIFSDDIDFCKQLFQKEYIKRKIEFINLTDYLCFDLMRNCTHNIIANSTFSYWAAMLNENENKIVVSPDKWLGESETDNKELHFPKDWVLL